MELRSAGELLDTIRRMGTIGGTVWFFASIFQGDYQSSRPTAGFTIR